MNNAKKIFKLMNQHNLNYVDDNGFNESFNTELDQHDPLIDSVKIIWNLANNHIDELKEFEYNRKFFENVSYFDYIEIDDGKLKYIFRSKDYESSKLIVL